MIPQSFCDDAGIDSGRSWRRGVLRAPEPKRAHYGVPIDLNIFLYIFAPPPLQSRRMAGNDADHRSVDLLTGAEAHIWLVRLDEVGQDWPDWEQVLAPGEIAKAKRFLEPADRFRSAATRAVLRRFLGYYLDLPPARFQFVHNRFGKPALAEPDRAAA